MTDREMRKQILWHNRKAHDALLKHEEDIEKGLAEPVNHCIAGKKLKSQPSKPKPPVKGFSQADGLDRAYQSPDRMWMSANGTLYIAGTSRLQDIGDDIKLVLPGQGVARTFKYAEVMNFIQQHGRPKRIVGHSLGGAVAYSISQQLGIPFTTYGAPVASWDPIKGHHRNFGDWVSLLNMGAQTDWPHSWNVHDYHDEASRLRDDES